MNRCPRCGRELKELAAVALQAAGLRALVIAAASHAQAREGPELERAYACLAGTCILSVANEPLTPEGAE